MSSIGCIIIDAMKEYLCETAVPISPQTTILALKQLLKDMKPTILGDVDIDMLEVWKCTALTSDDDDPEVLQ